MNTIGVEDKLGITFCDRQAISIDRGEGVYVWDEAGKQYLDFTSGWGVTCLGHSHPLIIKTIYAQAQKIIQNPNSGFTYSPSRAALLSVLKSVLPENLSKVFFANSGAEANDAAIKLARKVTGRSKIVSTVGSFHGRTFNTLTVSGGIENTARYLPTMVDTHFVTFADVAAMKAALDDTTAAVILEPIQGEGGVRIPAQEYLSKVSNLCREFGALLIVDEVQTGFCRTGKFFALDHSKLVQSPDILTMGKGIAGGFPFAAFAVSAEVDAKIQKGDHGGTYCGNPLGCAVAAAVVQHLRDKRIHKRVAVMGKLMMSGLESLQRKYPLLIRSVRGEGLLLALQMSADESVQLLSQTCLERGLLVTPTRNGVIRLLPSLLLERREMEQGIQTLDAALAAVVPLQ
jgi:acetylornithine/N-succinyldiaminopimelate aminotransferase